MVQVISLILASLLIGLSQSTSAQVLFEGYSKVLSGGAHIGFSVSRYEFDTKKKQFISTYFLKTNEFGGGISESLKATASEDMKPISYQYTTLLNNQVKTIDATFANNKINAVLKDGNKINKISKDLPKGTFLSTFLAYMMLRSSTGFKPETRFEYQAIAEEDAEVLKGVAIVKPLEDWNGLKAFRVLNEFKNSKFLSYVTEKGEILSTKVPVSMISTELVSDPASATAGLQVPTATLRTLFGEVPKGQVNEVAVKKIVPSSSKVLEPGKQQGIPGGKGLQLKGQSPSDTNTPSTEK